MSDFSNVLSISFLAPIQLDAADAAVPQMTYVRRENAHPAHGQHVSQGRDLLG